MKKKSHPIFRWLAGLLTLSAAVFPASSALFFTTISTNGPATNRINLVFFSEGYLNTQSNQFLIDATNAANAFLSAQPYAEYAGFFNVFAIFTNSAHAGSTHLNYTAYTNGHTCFNSTYDTPNDKIITIPPNPSDANYTNGQRKIDLLLKTYLPSTNQDLPALLVNDPVQGGSDNYGKTAIASVADVNFILVHESGHTLGKLGDEYTTAYPGYATNDVEPNTTTKTNYSQIKWNAWISTNTPLPTPPTTTYEFTVGLFEGAHYHTTGWYRPFYNCCMQSFGVGFCPVCQEALVLAIYGKIRPLESRSPATNSLTVTSLQMLTFSLNLLQPATHDLSIQWSTNNVAIVGATNPVLNLWPAQLGNGTHKVEADVWDATDMVRTDVKNLLKQTITWTVNVAVPALQIDSLEWQTNGSFSFRVSGTASAGVVVEMSTNLLQWTSVQTSSLSSGQFFYTNLGAKTFPKRFFRAGTPP